MRNKNGIGVKWRVLSECSENQNQMFAINPKVEDFATLSLWSGKLDHHDHLLLSRLQTSEEVVNFVL